MSNSYIISNTEGSLTFIVDPGTLNGPGGVDRDSDLFLYGQGSTQWGEGASINLLRLLETFACPEKEPTDAGYVAGAPRPKDEDDFGSIERGITTPLNGQLWYNTTKKSVYTYDLLGDEWRTSSGLYIDTDPTTPVLGDLKYDSNFHGAGIAQLTMFDGSSFISTAQEYVRLAGDTMTGTLNLGTNFITDVINPVNPQDAATKDYVDNSIGSFFVLIAGSTMTGFLTLSSDPTDPLHAVTKQYADTTFVDAVGDTMSGTLDMGTNNITNVVDPVSPQDASTKAYVDAVLSTLLTGLWPVGSVFIGTDPTGTLPGTWAQMAEGTFLMASGGGAPVGSTGGANTKTLSISEMPVHNHTGSASSGGSHFHNLRDSNGANLKWSNYGPNLAHYLAITHPGGYRDGATSRTQSGGSHTHTLSISNKGSGSSWDSRPQYEAVEVWKRTA